MNRKDFEIRKLDSTHLDQFNELLRYVFQVTESDLARSGYVDSVRSSKQSAQY